MRSTIFKRAICAAFAFSLLIGFSECTTVHHHKTVVVKKKRIPPGHAKKIHGDKSAKKHAHGHNK